MAAPVAREKPVSIDPDMRAGSSLSAQHTVLCYNGQGRKV